MLRRYTAGTGNVEATSDGWRLLVSASPRYCDAQLDDTQGRARRSLLHRPPVKLSLEARASGPVAGTLGFGFWNDPFPSLAGEAGARRLFPASPQALWFFFSSPPSDLPFSRDGAGAGWRAASLHAPALPGFLVAALGAAAFAALALRPMRRKLISLAWRAVDGAQSASIERMQQWRRYEINWTESRARFSVDGAVVLDSSKPPTDPLGLVLWIDNQWATFSVEKGLHFGVLPLAAEASLEIRNLRLDGRTIDIGQRKP